MFFEASWNVMAHAQKPDFVFRTKRTSQFKSAGASVQWTTGSRGVRISGSNAGYTTFRGSVKGTGYPLHSPLSPSLPLTCDTVCHHISTELYTVTTIFERTKISNFEAIAGACLAILFHWDMTLTNGWSEPDVSRQSVTLSVINRNVPRKVWVSRPLYLDISYMQTLFCFETSVQGYPCCSITTQTKEIPSIIFSHWFLFLILIDEQTCNPSDYHANSDIRQLINNVLKIYRKTWSYRNFNQTYSIENNIKNWRKPRNFSDRVPSLLSQKLQLEIP